jgi:hypothetical protein
MNALLICIAAASLGWKTGHERLPEGGMEYIIQLDAPAIDALQHGQPISSYIRPDIGQVRSFRIVMGTGEPKRETPWPAPAVKSPPPKAAEKPAAPKAVEAPAPQQPEAPAKPWLPLTLTLLALFASLGLNVFLGWIAVGLRRRCQSES